tara:strand:+ start:1216 stop:2109 length:894 start_codon:yes stop_codon:yes gene_type:complete
MLNFFDNPRDNILGLQALVLACIFIIGAMLYYIGSNTDELHAEITSLQNEINTMELECPKCPDHPEIPACPKCPDVSMPDVNIPGREACPQCPDCNCPENNECLPCPDCSATADCPTLEDIIGGIFPGRNTGVTSGGKYFDVQANESYELLPDYDFYQPMDAFPTDSILEQPLRSGNVSVPEDSIENSIDNSLINTSGSRSLNDEDARMERTSMGEQTGPSSLPTGSSTWGSNTTRMPFENRDDPVESARREAEAAVPEDASDDERISIGSRAAEQQRGRNLSESNQRDYLASGAGG